MKYRGRDENEDPRKFGNSSNGRETRKHDIASIGRVRHRPIYDSSRIFLPTPRMFGLGPDFDTGYPVLFTRSILHRMSRRSDKGCHASAIPRCFLENSYSFSGPRESSPLLLFPLLLPRLRTIPHRIPVENYRGGTTRIRRGFEEESLSERGVEGGEARSL